MMEDAATVLRLIMGGQMCFFALLFSVKMSLLTLYRKLLAGSSNIYKKIWWGVLVFCFVVSAHDMNFDYDTDSLAGMDWKRYQHYIFLWRSKPEFFERKMRWHSEGG